MIPEDLKQKVEDIKRMKQELSTKEGVIHALSSFYWNSSQAQKERVANNKELVLTRLTDEISNKIGTEKESMHKIIETLNAFGDSMTDETVIPIIDSLKKILSSLKKLEQKKYFDKEEFDQIFTNGIEEITSVILSVNEQPTNTKYNRNSKGDITKVIESYNNYTIEYTWSYDGSGNLSNVKTIRKDDQTT